MINPGQGAGGCRSPHKPSAKMTMPKNAMIGPATAQKLEFVMGLLLLMVPRPWNMKMVPNTAMSAPPIIMTGLRRRDCFGMY
jgi:hypothetical protein